MTRPDGLVDYGIQTCQADICIYVCPEARHLYVFFTEHGRAAIESGRYPLEKVWRGDQVVGEGHKVPPDDIYACVPIRIPDILWGRFHILPDDDESTKGRKAEALVAEAMRLGLVPMCGGLYPRPNCLTKEQQISGIDGVADRVASHGITYQVKCDCPGGDRSDGGSGYLFLQTAERNPKGMI